MNTAILFFVVFLLAERKMMKAFIIGAGFSGAVCARVLADKGVKVKVIEQNDHIGGNAYDYDDGGILVHKYGPHIFHTNHKEVFSFLSRFTEWLPYEHRVLGFIDNKLVPIPFNLQSVNTLFSKEDAEKISDVLKREYGEGSKVPILQLKNHSLKIVSDFAEYVYQKVFFNYTLKQWGFTPDKLPKGVTERVPVYISFNDRYFTDEFQHMPKDGFSAMFNKMLESDNISVALSARPKITFCSDSCIIDGESVEKNDKIIFTGCIDALLNNKFGALPYRSLQFDFSRLNIPSYQEAAVVNYPNTEKYTRITEFTKFTCKEQSDTIIVKEYPIDNEPGKTIPYYPIERDENKALYKQYYDYISQFPNFYALGRLAEYKYINMDIAALNAIRLAEKIVGEN